MQVLFESRKNQCNQEYIIGNYIPVDPKLPLIILFVIKMKSMFEYIATCPHCGKTVIAHMPFPLNIMELNKMKMDCPICAKEYEITRETFNPYIQQ